MDSSEKLADACLRTLGFKDVEYEPDGNVPPDFLCDGRIAVEVRRLNQNFDDGNGMRGLEEVSIPLQRNVRKLLQSLGPPTENHSWFVFYSFGRPVPNWKTLAPKINETLSLFIPLPAGELFEKVVDSGFTLKVFAASKRHPTKFLLGGFSDEESGGWLIEEIEQNLTHCIAEKQAKLANVRARYPEWWLIFPDQIAYGLDDLDKQLFQDQISIEHDFDKIILLDPRDHNRSFVIT